MVDFFHWTSVALGMMILFCLYRGIRGPGFLNRIVAVNVIGTKIVIILALIGFMYNRIDMFVDISVVYALLNFIGPLAAAKFLERKGTV
jgi:multicomponent Na+:H+ antiporter subunit F